MSYIDTLNDQQKINLNSIIKALKNKNIVNNYSIAAILSIVSKECNFVLKSETSYAKTSNDRIRLIFGSRVKNYSEDELTNLKQHPEQFFDVIYGGRYGNASDEGWKYRGRGFNQLTFKANYKKIADQTTLDIVRNPDLVNIPEVAAVVLAQYFINSFKTIPDNLKAIYNTDSINGFSTLKDAVQCFYHANAGWGKTVEQIKADPTGGLQKANSRCEEFLNYISK